MKVFLVGGSVRDLLLGLKPKDRDFAVETDWLGLKKYVGELGGEVLHEKAECLTVRARFGREVVDFACCRREGEYVDGRTPENVEPATLLEDLARRDFTVNAMAMLVDKNAEVNA